MDLNNKYRVLLTETLPYELPLSLNNDSFYENMLNEDLHSFFNGVFSDITKDYTIPFDYNVRRFNGVKSRKLSLMHPALQLKVADFYEKNDGYLLKLCAKSPFSLRYIASKARCIFPIEMNEDNDEEDDGVNSEERKIEMKQLEIEKRYRSYFTYKRYDLMYKFFNSGDNLRLEQKYRYLLKMDIASCFYHIYTHTISWAVKGKESAKANRNKDTFENCFDKLMQCSNYNETNGIIVGPEVSRIFAEVILQSIDVAVLNLLKEANEPLRVGKDYEVRRYVDDFYVFANKREILDKVKEAFKKELEKYKLYLNKSKLEYFDRPFVSNLTVAKTALNVIVNEFKQKYLTKDNGEYTKKTLRMNTFTKFVNQFRSIAKEYDCKYGELNRYMLSLLSKQIRKERESGVKPFEELLTIYVEISFYIFSLDMSTTASYRLCRIIQLVIDWCKNTKEHELIKENVEARINREVKRCFDIYGNQVLEGDTNMEVMNILLTIDSSTNIKIPEKTLCSLFHITGLKEEDVLKLNYFQVCTLLRLIKNDEQYAELHEKLTSLLPNLFDCKESLKKADKAQLLFDISVCPYVDRNIKLDIIEKSLGIKNRGRCGIWLSKANKTTCWFFDWDPNHNISQFLYKKEYHVPYE